ncbi:MAG TPA: M10 family metallopeptidase C-terminal domain-containing protein, partial [Lautropia sp.]|nr:M10 family metallopeptidase C-terminal domain-containing protein [Lautropia sp.]
YNGTPGPGASLLGRASPPGEESEGQMEYNAGDERYNEAGLTQGGFFFTTLLHEFGHAHGMSHPHDNGGRSSIMRGAGGGTGGIGGAYGDFGLSQGVFTVMSYNDGYDLRPDMNGAKPDDAADNGWVGTLSPLDIAVIQDKYGVNEEYNRGNNTYELKDAQVKGTFYASIWDGGGIDEIVYNGARDATVDLRPATLKYEEGGGGRVSYVSGIHGGYTIANGVTIENVRTDAGKDVVNGNAANNRIETRGGDDTVNGGAGDDLIIGGTGFDVLTGGDGADTFVFETVADSSSPGDPTKFDRITDFAQGVDKIDLDGFAAANFIGTGNFTGQAGQLRFGSFGGDTLVQLDADGDGNADFNLMLTGNKVLTKDDFIGVSAGPANLVLTGTAGNDSLLGGAGDDRLIGLAGNDTLNGGAGNDTADYSGSSDNFRMELWITGPQNAGRSNGSDTLISIENLIGGSGANQFYGSDMDNLLDGGAGADLLDGRGGNDVLIGGLGKDQLAGRAGSDTFVFRSVDEIGLGTLGSVNTYDRIIDFTRGSDKIDLSQIDAIAGTSANDAFSFIGSGAFTKKAGELRYSTTSSGTVVSGDVNGDGVSDFDILLVNKVIPTVTDFLL